MAFFPMPMPGRVPAPHVNPMAPLPAFTPPSFDALAAGAAESAGTAGASAAGGAGLGGIAGVASMLPLLLGALGGGGGGGSAPSPALPGPAPVDGSLLASALGRTNQGSTGVPSVRR